MKKFYSFTLAFLILSSGLFPQQDERFYVTAFNGKVVNKRTGKALTYGDIVYSRDTLVPVKKDYYIGLANRHGMYELTPSTPGQQANEKWSEFSLAVYNSFFKQVEIKNMASRGIDTHVMDIVRFFHPGDTLSENRILLLSLEKIVAKAHSLDNGNTYYITPEGKGSVILYIKNIRDTMVFRSTAFLVDDSSGYCGPYDLYNEYTMDGTIHRKRITDFAIVFITASEAALITDNFLKIYGEKGEANEKDLMTALEFLFTHCYRAAPRGILLKRLLEDKVKRFLNNH